jgi:DNA-binding transcriptional regulator YdaS (Cro superfamily)
VVAAVLLAGSEKAAAHRLGLSHSTVKHHLASARSKVGATTTAQLVWILAPQLPAVVEATRAEVAKSESDVVHAQAAEVAAYDAHRDATDRDTRRDGKDPGAGG